jgi:hypothetical protein
MKATANQEGGAMTKTWEEEMVDSYIKKEGKVMDEMDVTMQLDELADLQLGQDAIRLRKQEEIDLIITPEIKERLAEIDAKYQGEMESIQSRISVLDYDIRQAVLKLGESIKGSRLHAVWNKGRVSWDTRALDGYSKAHPELNEFRKEGEPSISIRPVK